MTEPSPETTSDVSDSTHVPGTSGGRKSRKAEKKPLPVWQESILLLGIALVLAIGIKFFFIQAFYIPSPSMEPLFIKNDRILVQKVSYWFGGSPQRGDIVVFADPGDWLNEDEGSTAKNPLTKTLEAIGLYPSGGHLVKRVIGLGGDKIDCDPADTKSQGKLMVNGRALEESSYLPANAVPCEAAFHVQVPAGHLWVMGDNRGDSADSRAHIGDPGGGYVAEDLVVGKVWALIWPAGRATRIHTPETFKGIPESPTS
ncbi:MAG: signal peptidase I [Propionibacteriales bacterium]|nr:signal peptidase I [Propionibacteriales bacterium]